MSKLTWAPEARTDLDELHDYYVEIAPDFADRVSREAVAAARFLAAHPHAGERMSREGVRKWSIRRVPFILLCKVTPEGIDVVQVAHVREDWKSAFR